MSPDSPSSPEPTPQPPETQTETAPSPEKSDVPNTSEKPPSRFRWKTGLILLLVGLVIQASIWIAAAPDRTIQVFSAWIIVPTTLFSLFIWWTFFSGLTWSTRWKGLAALLVLFVILISSVRVDGYYGDMVPILSFRWNTSPEERAEAFFSQQEQKSSAEQKDSPDQPPLTADADDWPQFRGPQRDGIVRNETIRRNWDENPPQLLWKHPVGLGWSSFAVVDNFAFTQEQRGEQETVVCYDFTTGEQIWQHTDPVRFSEEMGGDGPRATPTFHDGYLYCLGATGILNCLEARSGRLVWTTNILQDAQAENIPWAMAGSPLVVDDKVIVNPGGGQGRAVIAYDRKTGEEIWSAGSQEAGYAAPRLETVAGKKQILLFDSDGVAGYPLDGNSELWRFPWTNTQGINATQPIKIDENQIFVSTGYGKGSALVQLAHQDGDWAASQRWTSSRFKLKFNDAILHDGYIYGLDEGILACIDPQTGDRQWKRGRYRYGQLLLVGDVLLVQAESGEVALVEADPEQFSEITRFQAIEGKTWNHPVYVRGKLLVRNAQEAACYDLRQESTSTPDLSE